MNDELARAADIRKAFDQIEESYEFMLAYAAQGRKREVGEGGGESQIRLYLKRFGSALTDLESPLGDVLKVDGGEAYARRTADDIATAKSVISLLLSRPSISSDMIDNTNGLIAIRAFLTDLFFIDQVALPPR